MEQYDDEQFHAAQPAPPGLAGYQAARPSPQAINAVEKYDGTADAHAWLSSFCEYADLYDWDDTTRLKVAKLRMRNASQNWVHSRKFRNWDDFQSGSLDRFGITQETAVARLIECKQKEGESVNNYSERFMLEAERAGRLGDDGPDMALVYQFVSGLHEELQVEVKRKELHSISAIVRFCNYWQGCYSPSITPAKKSVKFSDEPYAKPHVHKGNHKPASYSENRRPPEHRYRYEGRTPNVYKPYRPPPFRESTNMGSFPPPQAQAPKPTPPPAASSSMVDDLTKKMERLELNMAQQLKDKDREVRYLRHALQQSGGRQPSFQGELNLMQTDEKEAQPAPEAALHYFQELDESHPYHEDPGVLYLQEYLPLMPQNSAESADSCLFDFDDASYPDSEAAYLQLDDSILPLPLPCVEHCDCMSDEPGSDSSCLDILNYMESYDHCAPVDAGTTDECLDTLNYMTSPDQSTGELEIDYEYMSSLLARDGIDIDALYAKHARDENDVFSQRMPHKRAAIDPTAPPPYVPNRPPIHTQPSQHVAPKPMATPGTTGGPRPSPAGVGRAPVTPTNFQDSAANNAGAAMPRARKAYNARPYGAAPSAPPQPAASLYRPASGPATTALTEKSEAAKLAEKRGKELAESLCKSMKIDGCKEGNVVPRAVMTCCAGHLTSDPELVEKGKQLARQVEAVLKRISPARPSAVPQTLYYNPEPQYPQDSTLPQPCGYHSAPVAPPQAPSLHRGLPCINHAQAATTPYRAHAAFYNREPVPPSMRPPPVSTCKVMAKVNGNELEAVVDTGASSCAISNDCLRRLGLQHLVRTELQSSYLNADGHVALSKGKIPLHLTLGSMTTLCWFTVTEAYNYEALLGGSLLVRIGAIVDYGKRQMVIQPDIGVFEAIDINLSPSSRVPLSLSFMELNVMEETCQSATASDVRTDQHEDFDPHFSALMMDFFDAIFSLPPHPPEVPGWTRCISEADTSPECREFKFWMQDRVDTIVTLQAQLEAYMPDPSPDFLLWVDELHQEAGDAIMQGITSYPTMTWEDILATGEPPKCTDPSSNNSTTERPNDLGNTAEAATVTVTTPPAEGTAFLLSECHIPIAEPAILSSNYWQELGTETPLQGDRKPIRPSPYFREWSRMTNAPAWFLKMPKWLKEVQPISQEAANCFLEFMNALLHAASARSLLDQPSTWEKCYSVLTGDDDSALNTMVLKTLTDSYLGREFQPDENDFHETNSDLIEVDNEADNGSMNECTAPPPWLDSLNTIEWLLTQELLKDENLPLMTWQTAPRHFTIPAPTDGTSSLPRTCAHQDLQAHFNTRLPSESLQEVLMALELPHEGMDRGVPALDHSCVHDNTWPAEPDDWIFTMDDPLEETVETDCYGPIPVHVDTGVTANDYVPVDTIDHGNHPDNSSVTLPVIDQPFSWALRDPKVLYVPEAEVCPFPDDVETLSPETAVDLILAGSKLTAEQQLLARKFLLDNADIMAMSMTDLGTCLVGAHTIDTGDHPPVRQGYYKMPYRKYEQLKEHINNMLKQGIIRKSTSPWASPMHLVPKKEPGSTRPICDYRKLNSVTKPDSFPLPSIDQIIYSLDGARWLGTIDLFQGFNQLLIAEPDIEKSAVITPWGLYEFLRMPFGLINAPATFQRAITTVLTEGDYSPEDQIGKHCFVYLDDVICYSKTFEDHLAHLGKIFEALRKANLKINPKKTTLFKDEVLYLGYRLGRTCKPDRRLLAAIENRRPPRDKLEVASFVGLCSYYRRFVKDFSIIAEPLTRVMGKTRTFAWGPEQQQAFDELKDKLLNPPILMLPDLSKRFKVYCDGSGIGVAGLLTQEDEEGRECLVACCSKKLPEAARRSWSITEIECYAVIYAVCEHWSPFLLQHPPGFDIITDHQALVWLMTAQHKGKLARWALRLSELLGSNCRIMYRPGAAHKSVDALTRWGCCDDDPDTYEDSMYEGATAVPVDELSTMQVHCADCPTPELLAVDPSELFLMQQAWYDEFYALEVPTNTSRVAAQAESPSTQATDPLLCQEVLDTSDDLANDQEETSPPRPVNMLPWAPVKHTSLIKPMRIIIDGNIGCGKSTVMEHLERHLPPEWRVVPEPLFAWQDLLTPFYEAPTDSPERSSIAALLQVAVLNGYAFHTPELSRFPKVIMERGPWSALEVFLPVQGLPAHYDTIVYEAAYNMRDALEKALPTAIVYLDADPQTCLQRIRSRDRPSEAMMNLEYLQLLHGAYKEALDSFDGPKCIIDAKQEPEAVAQAVLKAIDMLLKVVSEPFEYALPLSVRWPKLLLSQLKHDIPPSPRNLTRTCLDLQLLALQDSSSQGIDETTTSGESVSSQENGDLIVFEDGSRYEYMPTPLSLIYDRETEVPILYQCGSGTMQFSAAFTKAYLQKYGHALDPTHIIDNHAAVELFSIMAPWNANAPGSNIQLAIAPRKALGAIQVQQIHPDGAQTVYIDPETYAMKRYSDLLFAGQIQPAKETSTYNWFEGLRNEGYTLDSWIRVVRVRPLLQCGLSAPTPGFISSFVKPTDEEYSQEGDVQQPVAKLRLASSMRHQENDDKDNSGTQTVHPTLNPHDGQMNMLQEVPGPRTRRRQPMQGQVFEKTPSQTDEDDSQPPVDHELACQMCNKDEDPKHMLICSKCQVGIHTYCARPALRKIPVGDWFCHLCRAKNTAGGSFHSSDYKPSNDSSEADSDTQPNQKYRHAAVRSGIPLPALRATRTCPSVAANLGAGAVATAADSDSDGDAETEDDEEACINSSNDIYDDAAVLYYLKYSDFDSDLLPTSNRGRIKAEMKRITRRAANYRWDRTQNKLFRRPTSRYPLERVVPELVARPGIIDEAHDDLGHMGVARVCSIIMQRFYWPGIYKQVRSKIKECVDCLRNRAVFRQVPEMKSTPPSQLWERVSMDTLGPLPTSKKGNKYILIAVDNCSKWPECAAFDRLDADTVCRFFADRVVSNHGVPSVVVTDNGTEYNNTTFNAMLTSLGCQHKFSPSYHPQGNGMAEAVVKTVVVALQRCVAQDPTSWCEKLPMVLLGMRAARHSTHNYSPFYVCCGRHPKLPLEQRRAPAPADHGTSNAVGIMGAGTATTAAAFAAVAAVAADHDHSPNNVPVQTSPPINLASDSDELDEGTHKLLQDRQQQAQEVAVKVEQNTLASQERQKRDFRKRHHTTNPAETMPVGSLVLMDAPASRRSKLHKGLSREGPYRVEKYSPDMSQCVLSDANQRVWSVRVERITPYSVDQPKPEPRAAAND